MNVPIIDQMGMHLALRSRMDQNTRLGDRSNYIGASEIGSCIRRVVFSKLYPEPFDQASMGRMIAGRAMEGEIISLLRLVPALSGRLRNTGRGQLDLHHPRLPLHAHPDGVIHGGFDGLDGDGVLEVKTASAATFKRYQNDGLPPNYIDQVQAQMGLSGLLWALVVLISRENLSDLATFIIKFYPAHYARLEERAALAASALNENNILEKLTGEPERGFCHTCPYTANCAIYQAQHEAGQRGEIPEVTRLQLEAALEELSELDSISGPALERIAEIRDQVKTALICSGATKVVLDGGTVQFVESSRTNFDSKSLQRESPEIFSRFQKTSIFSNLRITIRGATQCLQTAS